MYSDRIVVFQKPCPSLTDFVEKLFSCDLFADSVTAGEQD